MNQVNLKIIKLNWLEGLTAAQDRCAHGQLHITIGEEIISTAEDGEWTTSAAALNLMRTALEDYRPGQYGTQLIPCCGHTMIASEDGEHVSIIGCPNGKDWSVHHYDDKVTLTTINDYTIEIPLAEYQQVIASFADEVEAFYNEGGPKDEPYDIEDKKGYEAFWKEWRRLRRQLKY